MFYSNDSMPESPGPFLPVMTLTYSCYSPQKQPAWCRYHLVRVPLFLSQQGTNLDNRLMATIGKVNKKAIQEVNVPGACETITDPGAPLALRLQGNLLYGLSRVYYHQCRYVLDDVEKTQSYILSFFCSTSQSKLDVKAKKTKYVALGFVPTIPA